MKNHIRNLDTFRAIAAIIVAIGHIELFRQNAFGTTAFKYMPSGHIGVILFFVISGFLITYLLLKEKEQYGKISLKDFWLRRIFRIWPVYYLVLLISAFFFETVPSGKTIAYALAIMPNFSHALECGWSTSPQIWSIGVENQFYLLFPIIVMLVPRKHLRWWLLLIIVGFAILPHAVDFLNVRLWNNADLASFNRKFFFGSKFDCLGIGCLAGCIYIEREGAVSRKWMNFLYNKWFFIVCLIAAVVFWGANLEFSYFTDEFMAVLFAVVILNMCTNSDLKINIENKVTKFLGKISYGIYMYHWIVLLVAFRLLPLSDNWYSTLLLYVFVLGGAVLVAWLSFISYERFFLNIKKRFER